MYRRIGWFALLGVVVFGFGAVILGPDTVNPLLQKTLGLQTPEPVEPAPVPGAEVVADRVKREITEAEVRALMATLHPVQIPRTGLSGARCRRAIYRTTLPRTGSKKRRKQKPTA